MRAHVFETKEITRGQCPATPGFDDHEFARMSAMISARRRFRRKCDVGDGTHKIGYTGTVNPNWDSPNDGFGRDQEKVEEEPETRGRELGNPPAGRFLDARNSGNFRLHSREG